MAHEALVNPLNRVVSRKMLQTEIMLMVLFILSTSGLRITKSFEDIERGLHTTKTEIYLVGFINFTLIRTCDKEEECKMSIEDRVKQVSSKHHEEKRHCRNGAETPNDVQVHKLHVAV